MKPYIFIVLYLIVVNTISIAITVHDKVSAIKGKWRISESTLLLFSALGGSISMYLTMLTIRHKTRKPKFMVVLPVIIIAQIALMVYLVFKYGT